MIDWKNSTVFVAYWLNADRWTAANACLFLEIHVFSAIVSDLDKLEETSDRLDTVSDGDLVLPSIDNP